MRRILAIAASVAILLALSAPIALAAEPATATGGVVFALDGTVDVPAGADLDAVVVIDGDATIAGDVEAVVVTGGTATLAGATVETLVIVDGTADLQAGTTVTGDVRTLRGSVTQESGAVIGGSVTALDTDLAAFALLMIPVFVVLLLGVAIAGIVVAVLVAAFAARQVREVEDLISRRPGPVLVAGIAGFIGLPLLAIVLMTTVIGAPIGFGLLFVLLPALAIAGWLVAAIWIGDWLVERMRGSREAGRPYLAAVLGVVVLAIAGAIPFVSAIATLFGFGGILLAAWRILRPEAPSTGPASAAQPLPSAS